MTIQEHLLVCLMEECAEITKEASKALRFGLDERYPDLNSESNKDAIFREFHDLVAVMCLIYDGDEVHNFDMEKISAKMKKVRHYLEYAEKQGTIDAPTGKNMAT